MTILHRDMNANAFFKVWHWNKWEIFIWHCCELQNMKICVSSCSSSTVPYLSIISNAKSSRLCWMLDGVQQLHRYPGVPRRWDFCRRKQNGMSITTPQKWKHLTFSLTTLFSIPQSILLTHDWKRRASTIEMDLMSTPHKLLLHKGTSLGFLAVVWNFQSRRKWYIIRVRNERIHWAQCLLAALIKIKWKKQSD